MSEAKSPQEPSMEEILSSIRRILAEDERGVRPLPPRLRTAADVLDLTEAVGDDGTVRHIEPAVVPRSPTEAPSPPPFDGRVEPAVPPLRASADDRLLSTPVSDAVASTFSRLASLPRGGERVADRSLDETVRETLRPMLQSWLDANLPALVERLVQAEIARLVGDAAKR